MSKRNEVTCGMPWAVVDTPGIELHHILLTFRFTEDPETNTYVGVCDELDISSFGDTVAEAMDNVLDATLLYLDTIEELGERRRVFDERGIQVHRGEPRPAPPRRGRPVKSGARRVTVQPNEIVTTRLVGLPVGA